MIGGVQVTLGAVLFVCSLFLLRMLRPPTETQGHRLLRGRFMAGAINVLIQAMFGAGIGFMMNGLFG